MKNTEVNLPQELIIEILSWLRIKHLYPLRFVSKTWFQLLTKDPQFAKLQFDRFLKSNPNPSIIALKVRGINENDRNLMVASEFESCDEAVHLKYPFSTNTYLVSAICNGLLCFSRRDHKEVYIWNPLINDHITIFCLPAPSIRFPGYHTRTGFLFGFDQDSNVYKLVRFFNETALDGNSWTQIGVYTVGVDSMWRTVEVNFPHNVISTSRHVHLVNGVLHWLTSSLSTRSNDIIVTFDMKGEVIGELPPPCSIKFNEIVELGGLLCVVDRNDVSEMHIWVMKEYGLVSSWSKQYIIGKPQGFCSRMCTLGFTHNGEIIIDRNGGNLVLYNPETNTVRDLKGFGGFEVVIPYAYAGSIISPTVISRAGHNLLEEES